MFNNCGSTPLKTSSEVRVSLPIHTLIVKRRKKLIERAMLLNIIWCIAHYIIYIHRATATKHQKKSISAKQS